MFILKGIISKRIHYLIWNL